MRVLNADQVWKVLQRGDSARLPDETEPKFSVGEIVFAKNLNHSGHIRLPEYVQGHQGVVERVHGCFHFPDAHVTGIKQAQYLYNVRFENEVLWGADSTDNPGAVYLDLFESYLVGSK